MKQDKKTSNHCMIRSSAAEYLTYASATGGQESAVELRYEDENLWLSQKRIAELYGVSVSAVNQHLKRLLRDSELDASGIKKYFITATDGKVTHELAKKFAESEFERYRIVQDRLFESDFDRFVQLEEKASESGVRKDTDGEVGT